MTNQKVIGRFAPSPTGPLHFGSLIAALASYLDARSRNGAWLVRMEDLDPPREKTGAADLILKTLDAFGLNWDDEVIYQSHRSGHYEKAINTIFAKGLAYYCTCSRKEVFDNNQSRSGKIYPQTCRQHVLPRDNAAIRVMTLAEKIIVRDRLQGTSSTDMEQEIGDFVVRRKDKLFAYHLAVVVDDAAQNITDVVRGADLLDSTPCQVYLQRMLALPTPNYLHVPLAVDAAGTKLSKQTLAVPVNPENVEPTLLKALRFLNQALPPHPDRRNREEILRWAIEHWNPDTIAPVKTISFQMV